MKKQLKLTLGLALVASLSCFPQEGKVQPCNTYAAMEEYFSAHPEARKAYEDNQQILKESYAQNAGSAGKAAAVVYTVPVVFHILHMGGTENVSDAQCIAALDHVNRDFAKLGSDANTVAQPFQNLYIDSEIKFMLAKKDPNGNCTTGIIHTYNTLTNWPQGNSAAYNGITWNPTKYLNIIIVAQVIPSGTVAGGGIIVGYTYKPGSWSTGASPDCIVYRHDYLNGFQARSLSHEIGHWLNLSHTFGNTNNPGQACGDDGIVDTPPTKGNYGACPSSLSGNSCAGATAYYSAGQDNVENIMDYSGCPKNFTGAQTTAMRNALASSVSLRNNLWSNSNITSTDVNGVIPCAPTAEFLSTNGMYTVCAGGTLNMKDYSYNGTITSYQWSTNGGAVIASASSSVTPIMFPTVGVTNVMITVSNAQGTSSKTRPVYVLDATPGISTNLKESFENFGIPTGWSVNNKNPGSSTWNQTYNASYDQFASFYLEGATAGPNQEDVLTTPIIDLQSIIPNDSLTFAMSYAQKANGHNDQLKVQASMDCGASWSDLKSYGAVLMQSGTGGVTSASWTPVIKEEWKRVAIGGFPWITFTNSPHVLIRFVFTEASQGFGNNLYIDAISIGPAVTSSVGLNELSKSLRFNLYPNPSTGEAGIKFRLNDPANVKVSVYDVLGKEVISGTESVFAAGEHQLSLNKNAELPKGIYMVNLSVNGAKLARKLVIN